MLAQFHHPELFIKSEVRTDVQPEVELVLVVKLLSIVLNIVQEKKLTSLISF